ncbi:MAG: DUF5050 domain-containing protein [Lachnospiraceae bacterium]|nr:DUF5050 domain-containing protein [Lachnospiraceae bacterium]
MNKTLKTVLLIAIPVVLIAGIIIVRAIVEKAQEIPDNAPDLFGNTAGNLYNGGSFCEHEGTVYFSNPYDGGSIYAFDTNHENMRKVITADASFLNAAGGYIYYFSASSAGQSGLGYVRDGRGVYRVDDKGKRNILLNRCTTDSLLLLGNNLYYTDFGEDEKKPENAVVRVSEVSKEGESEGFIIDDHVRLAAAYNGEIYYAAMTGNHHLFAYNPLTGQSRQLGDFNMYEPVVQGNVVYFLDLDDDMHLKSWFIGDSTTTLISDERIETFNLYGDTIYYQTTADSGYYFKKIRVDGTGETTLKDGVVSNIQVTSEGVYFTDFNSELPLYRIAAGGSSIMVFQEAADAVSLPE